ncbi:MAG: hypothetical protein PVJ53_12295 [Desulfobacterales bacterium]|jgi:hypothetical protein
MKHGFLKWTLTCVLLPGLLLLGCAGSSSNQNDDGRYINKTDKINTERDRNERRKEILEGFD